MSDPMDAVKDVVSDSVSKSVGKVVDSQLARNLLGPLTEELGEMLGNIANATRFYANENMSRILGRWAARRNGKVLEASEINRILPLLPTACLIADEELQELWARLLDSFAAGSSLVLPSFGQTLSQLTASEAIFLEAAWEKRFFPLRTDVLRGLYYRLHWRESEELGEYEEFPKRLNLALRLEFDVLLSDIVRLGILGRNSTFSETVNGELEELVAFTGYGRRFMRAIKGQLADDED